MVFINQLRDKIGSYYNNAETTTGGRALKFYASMRLEVARSEKIKNPISTSEVIGHRIKIKVTKNKVAPPFKLAEADVYYGEGISRETCLMDLGDQYKILEKSSSWYSFHGERLGQGRENVRQFLKEHPEMAADIEAKIREVAMPAKNNVVELPRNKGTL